LDKEQPIGNVMVLNLDAVADPTVNPKKSGASRRGSGPNIPRLVIGAVALIYGIIFIALNRGRVRIHFVFFTVTSRLWVGFVVCVAVGALLGQTIGAYRRRSKSNHPTGAT
jgi:uncharacterized integral membrane protein